jgi:hypothetical protein
MGDKALLRSLSVRESGKAHTCRRNRAHLLVKGDLMLVVKEARDERHYCSTCAKRFILTARERLDDLEASLP